MKKTIILLLLTQLLCVGVHAEVPLDKLEKAKNYLSNKLTFLRIQLLVKDKPSNVEAYERVRPQLESVNLENALVKDKLEGLVKEDFKGIWEKLAVPVYEIDVAPLLKEDPQGAAEALVRQAFEQLKAKYKAEYEVLASQQADLQMQIESFFKEGSTPVQVSSPQLTATSHDGDGSSAASIEQPGFFSLTYFNFWTLLSILLTVACCIFLLNNLSLISDKVKRNWRMMEDLRNQEFTPSRSATSDIKAQVDTYISSNPRLSELNRKVEEVLLLLQKQPHSSAPPASQYDSYQPLSGPIVATANEVFYMSYPTSNYFPLSAKSEGKENTLYKFSLKPNKREATFEVHNNGAPIKEVLELISRYIEPACIQDNIPGAKTRSIYTKTPGTAALEGDKWVIQSKAVIKYE